MSAPVAFPSVAIPVRAAREPALVADDLPLQGLLAEPDSWDRLIEDAERARPTFARACLQAHREAGLAGGLRALVVRRGGRWLALLPYLPRGAPFGLVGRADAAWGSLYTTSSDPLLAADALDEAAAALVEGMARRPGPWLFRQLTVDGRIGTALAAAFVSAGWATAVLDPFERPVLDRGVPAFSASRRKDLRRRRRRLEEAGAVAFASATEGPALREAVEQFLLLEATGWKGRRGTSFASTPERATLARALFGDASGGLTARADLLTLDGRAIAASLSLLSGGTSHLLKSAYDETLSKFAPGLLLEAEITDAFAASGFAERLDSAAGPGSHMADVLPGRERIGDLVAAPSRMALDRRLAGERRRRALRERAKAWLGRLRARRGS